MNDLQSEVRIESIVICHLQSCIFPKKLITVKLGLRMLFVLNFDTNRLEGDLVSAFSVTV